LSSADLTSAHEESSEYRVTSWQAEEKAVALAVTAHTLKQGKPIFRVTVKRLGPAADDIPARDLFDPMEKTRCSGCSLKLQAV